MRGVSENRTNNKSKSLKDGNELAAPQCLKRNTSGK